VINYSFFTFISDNGQKQLVRATDEQLMGFSMDPTGLMSFGNEQLVYSGMEVGIIMIFWVWEGVGIMLFSKIPDLVC